MGKVVYYQDADAYFAWIEGVYTYWFFEIQKSEDLSADWLNAKFNLWLRTNYNLEWHYKYPWIEIHADSAADYMRFYLEWHRA